MLETVYVDPAHNPDCEADDFSGSGRTICRANECGDGDDACVANQLAYCRDCEPAPHPLFAWFEDLIIPVFTAEYLARLLTVHAALCIDSDQLIGATQSAAGVAAFSGWRVGLKRTWKFCTRPLEVFDLIRGIQDPEHPHTLEQLNVAQRQLITVDDARGLVQLTFTPTIPHCSMATLIGLCIRVKLLRSLPTRFKVDIQVTPGTHASEAAVNKQLNDKERVAAALENDNLLGVVNKCLLGADVG